MSVVLAAIDNSAAARPVLIAATALARILGAEVQAVYVAEGAGQTARASAEDFGVTLTTLTGEPLRQIMGRAVDDNVVAIAVGARRWVSGGRIGHTASAIANEIAKPVLVVPPDAMPAERLRRVLIGMKGSRGASRGIKGVFDLAEGADLDVVIVHVDDEASIPGFSDQVAHETESYATEFLAHFLHGAPKARLELRVGDPATEIVAAGDSVGADLLAIGWPQSKDNSRGAVAREVLDRSHVPVLLVTLASAAQAGSPAPGTDPPQ